MTNGFRIAFSHRFKECPGVAIIQARPNFSDYTPEEKQANKGRRKDLLPDAPLR